MPTITRLPGRASTSGYMDCFFGQTASHFRPRDAAHLPYRSPGMILGKTSNVLLTDELVRLARMQNRVQPESSLLIVTIVTKN